MLIDFHSELDDGTYMLVTAKLTRGSSATRNQPADEGEIEIQELVKEGTILPFEEWDTAVSEKEMNRFEEEALQEATNRES